MQGLFSWIRSRTQKRSLGVLTMSNGGDRGCLQNAVSRGRRPRPTTRTPMRRTFNAREWLPPPKVPHNFKHIAERLRSWVARLGLRVDEQNCVEGLLD